MLAVANWYEAACTVADQLEKVHSAISVVSDLHLHQARKSFLYQCSHGQFGLVATVADDGD